MRIVMFVLSMLALTGGAWLATSRAQVDSAAEGVAQDKPVVPELEVGKPVERELVGGEAHSYPLTLASGQYLHVVVDQRGIDVVVTLVGPDGQQISTSERRRQGLESVCFVVKASGIHQVQVRSLDEKALPGRYEVKVAEQRRATPQDEERMAMRKTAERAFAEGLRLSEQTLAESRQKAIEKYEEALTLWQSLGDLYEQGHAVNKIGYVYQHLGQMQMALDYFHHALQLFRSAGNRSGEGAMLAIIGIACVLGDSQKAVDYLHQALPLLRSMNDRMMEAAALASLGSAYVLLEEKQNALYYLRQALPLWQALRDPYGEAQTLFVMGGVYNYFGQKEVASSYFREAERLRRGEGRSQEGTAEPWDHIAAEIAFGEGVRLLAQGTPESRRQGIEKLEEALQLWRATPDRRAEANLLFTLGSTYVEVGEPAKALDYLQKALPFWRTEAIQRAEMATLLALGLASSMLNRKPEALDFFRQALELSRHLGDRNAEAVALCNLARVERDGGHLLNARSSIESGLRILESLRTKIASPDWRATYNASNQEYYEFYTGLLMQLHKTYPTEEYDVGALQANERARARSLLETLTEARADIRQGVSPVLLENEHNLQQQLNDRELNHLRLLSGKPTPEQVAVAKKEIEEALAQYQEIQAEIRSKSPKYAALTQPEPLGLREIQQQVLDEDTLLLEYALGKDRSFLWAVTPTSITSFELPGREDIETAARRVYELLTVPGQRVNGETKAQQHKRLKQADEQYGQAAATLSQMLLGPVAAQLEKKRLLVVTEGALQYIPFGALPAPRKYGSVGVWEYGRSHTDRSTPTRPHAHTPTPPLIVDHEIVSLPSASVLGVLRRELSGRQPAPKTVVILADPVFESDDFRVKAAPTKAEKQTEEPSATSLPAPGLLPDGDRMIDAFGLETLERLWFTRHEAEWIAAFVPVAARLKALDFAANRATATSAELSQYRIVHFASHGFLNSEHPELSGIVFSLVNEQGQPQDGFLRLHEVYNLKLNADLVVLSACRTALGKEVKGEGLIGLTRGFMYAGAASVVASLWNVNDKSTAKLMRQFYQKMLVEGRRPAAALRAAQVAMWQEKKAPYYWAAFVLQGEWK